MARNKQELWSAQQDKRNAQAQIRNVRKIRRQEGRKVKASIKNGTYDENSESSKRYNAAVDQINSGKKKKRAAQDAIVQHGSTARSMLRGAAKGAIAGSAVGPWGTALGAIGGAYSGLGRKLLTHGNRANRLREEAAALDSKKYKNGGGIKSRNRGGTLCKKKASRKYAYGGQLDPAYVYAAAPKRTALPTATVSYGGAGLALAPRASYVAPTRKSTRQARKAAGVKMSRGGRVCRRKK